MTFGGTKTAIWLTLLVAVFACVPCQRAFSTDFSIDAVFFNEKLPSTQSTIDQSVVDSSESLQVLKNDANAINSLKEPYKVKIVGHTDSNECTGHDCADLSLRRAQLVYNWMVASGVPRSRLLSPEGHGSDEPVANNAIPSGRARNRYVEFQVVPNTAQP